MAKVEGSNPFIRFYRILGYQIVFSDAKPRIVASAVTSVRELLRRFGDLYAQASRRAGQARVVAVHALDVLAEA